jgi:hypothetical protein
MSDKRTNILERDSLYIALMIAIIIGFCGRVLFTDQIIRASDVITQFFWGAKGLKEQSLLQFIQGIPGIFRAGWSPLSDGGRTLEGGWNAIGLLFHRYLIQHFFPFPSSIAWLAVLSLCWGGIGTYFYSRLIGVGRFGAFVAGLLFALCTENASLINAGHIQKIETICWFPWVLLFMEKALRSDRLFHYAMTALMLALQFFNMHWQISFYSCLAVGAYWCFHVGGRFLAERGGYAAPFRKDLLLAVVLVGLFFSTIAMSFVPLYSWSRQSERGDAASTTSSASGNTGGVSEKGIGYEEGMSWSMPPEEILTFIAPGLFGFSRQEGGDVPAPGQVYYWGRMRFTQTNDYLGLLPWFLIPLPLLFRRDRTTWFCTFLMAATLVMALGKYTFVYRFMFDYLPGFSKFRVPKMILFLFAFGSAVLAGKGIDVLARQELPDRKKIVYWLRGCAVFVALIALLWLVLQFAGNSIANALADYITAPTRYQEGEHLVGERYDFMLRETGMAFAFGCAYLALLVAWFRKWVPATAALSLLVTLFICDLWRVNDHFFVVAPPPVANKQVVKNDIADFLKPRIDHYRMQPLNEDTNVYAEFPNISAYVTISERRYKQYLNSFNLVSSMPDIMNLKYVVMPAKDYEEQKGELSAKYSPVFTSVKGSVVLENKTVFPKAWLVPSVMIVEDVRRRIGILANDPQFAPSKVAIVETQPPIQMANSPSPLVAGNAAIQRYEADRIAVQAQASVNALLVLGEKYYKGWKATIDGKNAEIVPVDHILRGVYLTPGNHTVEFVFESIPFKVGKYVSLASFVFYAAMFALEWWNRRRVKSEG